MTLALIVAFLAHPIAWLLILSALGLIGMAVNASGPMKNFGVFSASGVAQLAALVGTYYSTLGSGVTTGALPANAITGGFDVFLNSAATTPGTQTTRTAAQMWQDAVNQFGTWLNDPAISTNGLQYTLQITNSGGSGTLTLAAGTGVTLVGATQTVANGATRQWVVNLTPTAATLTCVGTGTYN
jgi:hypothetical protein